MAPNDNHEASDWRARAAISVPEAAAVLGIGVKHAYALAHAGELPLIRLGRRMLIPTCRLRAMLGEGVGGSLG